MFSSFALSTKQSNCEIINVHSGHIRLIVMMPISSHKSFMKSTKRVEFSSVQHCRNVLSQLSRKASMHCCSYARVSKYFMVSSFLHKFPKAYNHNHSRESRVCDMRTEQDCFESVSLIFNECIDCHFLVIKCFESQRTFSVGVFKTREGMIWLLQIGMIHLTYDYY
jgi:hypothetical protein